MKLIRDRDIYQILNDVKNRKVIVYGSGVFAGETIRLLECLDVPVDYCIDTEPISSRNCAGKQVRIPDSVLREESRCFVLIAKQGVSRCMEILDSMGLRYLEDYNTVFQACGRINWRLPCPLDPTLGYSMQSEDFRDIQVFGNPDKATCRIAILGDSTSDPCAFPWKSWGELFYEICVGQGQSVAVLVGATLGHSSSQGLLKFIRDILPYRPHMVLSYSGNSDRGSRTPYVTSYQMKTYRQILGMGWEDPYGNDLPQGICCGERKEILPPADLWLHNQRILHGICREFSIRHIAFLQPTLICKKRGRRDEEVFFYVPEREVRGKLVFRERVREKMGETDYIVDATSWLDEHDGLFYDYAHVTVEGNRIVAERMYRYLFGGGA